VIMVPDVFRDFKKMQLKPVQAASDHND